MNQLFGSILKPKTLQKTSLVFFLAAAVVIALQHYFISGINNFKVFEAAFRHLIQLRNLYSYYPAEYDDRFLYAPPAAIWLGIFSILKTLIAVILLNVLTALSLWYVVYQLPGIVIQVKNKIAFFVFIELTTSLHHLQINALMTAMIIGSFILLEKNQVWKSHFITVYHA